MKGNKSISGRMNRERVFNKGLKSKEKDIIVVNFGFFGLFGLFGLFGSQGIYGVCSGDRRVNQGEFGGYRDPKRRTYVEL